MYKLTNNNLKLRYLAARLDAKEAGEGVNGFTYAMMGALFGVGKQAAYQWTRNTMPTSKVRRSRLYEWVNDGAIDRLIEYMREVE